MKLPVTSEQFCVWALEAPINGYNFVHPGSPDSVVVEWLVLLQEQDPDSVVFIREGFFMSTMIRTWRVSVYGIDIGYVANHEYKSIVSSTVHD